MEISIEFPEEQKYLIIHGKKHSTLRPTKVGNIRDTFRVGGVTCTIHSIVECEFGWSTWSYHSPEGFPSPWKMYKGIKQDYPDLNDMDVVYIHMFYTDKTLL